MAAASFPAVHVTGPVHAYVRAGGGANDIYYLGTTEVTPQVDITEYGSDVINDIAGKTLPFQRTDDGADAQIALMLSYFSKSALDVIRGAGTFAGRFTQPGTETRWSRGGLKFGVRTFELWLLFENALNPNGANVDLEIGWFFPQVELLKHGSPTMGSQAQKQMVLMHAQPEWKPQANPSAVTGNERGWTLFTTDPADFPDAVRIPQ